MTKKTCLTCMGSGEVKSKPGPNGMAMTATCPSCNGRGEK